MKSVLCPAFSSFCLISTCSRIYGDTAVMTGPQMNHEQIDGQPQTIKLFLTQVARRIDGYWKFVSIQATRIPD